jgi:hypothetical protein
LNFNGDEIKKGVLIPLGAPGDVSPPGQFGLTADGDNLMVVAVKFGSKAEKALSRAARRWKCPQTDPPRNGSSSRPSFCWGWSSDPAYRVRRKAAAA